MLACYSAGTPDSSAYYHWLDSLRKAGAFHGQVSDVLRGLPQGEDRPFIAAIPQAVLQNPNGPLAFIGHIDLAWTYSFQDLDSGDLVNRPGKFVQIISDLMCGYRCGIAFRALMLALGEANSELATLYDRAAKASAPMPELDTRRGHLWMLRQDLAGYVVLGDPAVRIHEPAPSARAPAPHESSKLAPPIQAPPEPANLLSTFGFQPAVSTPPETVNAEQMERAIAQLILEQKSIDELAESLKLSVNELRQQMEQYRQAGRAALHRPRS